MALKKFRTLPLTPAPSAPTDVTMRQCHFVRLRKNYRHAHTTENHSTVITQRSASGCEVRAEFTSFTSTNSGSHLGRFGKSVKLALLTDHACEPRFLNSHANNETLPCTHYSSPSPWQKYEVKDRRVWSCAAQTHGHVSEHCPRSPRDP